MHSPWFFLFFQDLGLTGKEQFLNNADIDLAPIGGGDGGGEVDLVGAAAAAVEVDESLFEDLDDLDVGDSDLDDSDANSDRWNYRKNFLETLRSFFQS